MDCFSFRCQNSSDVLGKSLANLQNKFNYILADAQREKEKAWARQRELQEEMASRQEKLEEVQQKYRQVRVKTTKQNKTVSALSKKCNLQLKDQVWHR